MIRTRLVGTGSALPARVVTNDDLAATLDTDDDWIRTRTGIRERRILSDGEATSDLAADAGRRACEAAGVPVSQLDLLVVATTTPDMPMPSCATITQEKLGARCPAFDVAAACAGFSYGLSVVDAFVRSGAYRRVLFVGAEALSRFLDWSDRTTCVLFGDGAGAVVAVPADEDPPPQSGDARGILACYLMADGARWRDLNIPGGGTATPPSAASVASRLHALRMNGRAIFTHAVKNLSDACQRVMAAAGLSPDDVDVVVPHQANLRILDAMARRMKIPRERLLVNLDRYGNTSSASIPIALDEAVRSGRVADGTTLLMCGLGAGLTWGAAAVRW